MLLSTRRISSANGSVVVEMVLLAADLELVSSAIVCKDQHRTCSPAILALVVAALPSHASAGRSSAA